MSEVSALQFLHAVRQNAAVRDRVVSVQDQLSLDDLVELGLQSGWQFDAYDLSRAFQYEWGMRRAFFQSKKAG